MAPQLPTSFKHRFPFTLASTSFVYPDDYVPNVRRLGPYRGRNEKRADGSLPARF